MKIAVLSAILLLVACLTAQGGEAPPDGSKPNRDTVILISDGMTFRRVSPRQQGTNLSDFFLLETEVTNDMYQRYLKATRRTRVDSESAAAESVRDRKTGRSGIIKVISTAPVYDRTNPSLLWTKNAPPLGRADNPVALITIGDAKAFCEWLTYRYPNLGLFRLPTVKEWLIAAYGANRKYPWGDRWSFDIPCVSSSEKNRRTATEPVKANAGDRTPEGIYGLWGNVAEYVVDLEQSPRDTRWMGPSFKSYPMEGVFPFTPRNDWWGYVHSSASRQEGIGFRVLLEEPREAHDR